jgi:3-oxosteroid 1-dehydrogenase
MARTPAQTVNHLFCLALRAVGRTPHTVGIGRVMARKGAVIVVGAGLGGMAAAIVAADRGRVVRLVEKSDKVGGAAAFSGGQVWVGANSVADREGIPDSIEETLAYVRASAAKDRASFDDRMAERWIRSAPEAATYFEQKGVIEWELIPDYPDYYYPDLPGAKAQGRYLTGAMFDATTLGAFRDALHVSPHFPVGITYPEMFSWGGMSSRTRWDHELLQRRRDDGILTFGPGVVGAFFRAVLARRVELLRSHAGTTLLSTDGVVTGIRVRSAGADVDLRGVVILATGAHDWSDDLVARYIDLPADQRGSVAPSSLTGDGIAMAVASGAAVQALPPWAAPVLPGYRLAASAFAGDTRYRACFEHCLPHTFLVNGNGQRFCDDSFHSAIVSAALRVDPAGQRINLPLFMIWDAQHHAKYGLGGTMPGQAYPDSLVASAATLRDLARQLSITPGALEHSADRFNASAVRGEDPEFGRGSNLSVRRFRGDWTHQPNPCIGPVTKAPFFGMPLRLLSTGIAAVGVSTDDCARALRADGSVIHGLYAIGECSGRAATGVGYNSGYSLSRAMAFGYIAALHAADQTLA